MSDRLEVVLIGKDQSQQAFRAVTTGAEKMGTTVAAANQKAARSSADFSKSMAALGAVAATGAALLGQWNRSAQDAAAIQRGLEQAIANTGHSFAEYADRIDAAGARAVQLGIDDEAASQAIAALTETTGSAATALELLGLAEDVSAAKGIGLVSAAELIGKVHEGNTAILQRYGIVVEKGASAEQALAAVQAQVAGQAEAHATTYARLREELANVTDAIGGTVGQFAPFLQMLPALSSGVTLAGAAIGALAPQLTAAGAASAALDVALGPVGLVLAAGAAAFAIYELTKSENENAGIAKAMQSATIDLTTALHNLAAEGSPLAAIGTTEKAALDAAIAQLGDLDSARSTLADTNKKLEEAERELAGTSGKQRDMIQANIDALRTQKTSLEDAIRSIEDSDDALSALLAVLTDTGTGAAEAQRQTQELFAAFARTHDANLLIAGLVELGRHLGEFDVAANKATMQTGALWRMVQGLPPETPGLFDRLTASVKNTTGATKGLTHEWGGWSKQLSDFNNEARHGEIVLGEIITQTNKWGAAQADAAADAAARQKELANTIVTIPDITKLVTAAFKDNRSALERVAAGSTSAAVQLRAFKDVQDSLLAKEDVYNAQYSEYGSQLDAIARAQDILNQRQADGIPLTQDQIDFLNGAAAASERLAGGQEDAAIAAGIAAEKYGENVSIGDKLNDTLGDVDQTTGDLTQAVRDLIAMLEGVPPNVATDIEMRGIDTALGQTDTLITHLNSIDGRTATAYTNVVQQTTYISGTAPGSGFSADRHGGVVEARPIPAYPVPHAQHGFISGGRQTVILGEDGQEAVDLPVGSFVHTAPATRARFGGRGGIGPITIHVYAQDGRDAGRQIASVLTAMGR